MMRAAWGVAVVVAALIAGCTPRVQGLGPARVEPQLQADHFRARDGALLPLRAWPAEAEGRAVIVALHGFNMYHRIFEDAAPWWAERGITVYAYDQRGFGAAPRPGIWGGEEAFIADARDLVRLVAARHPGMPVFLMGESMGAAVALLTLADDAEPSVAGAILVAPAVWGGRAMNPAVRNSLWFAVHTMPWNRATGNGLRWRATDNTELLRALSEDPLVIKHTRIDAVYGVTQLMGTAFDAASRLDGVPVLVLYGERDEIVPARPVQAMLGQLGAAYRLVLYPQGWHMLLSDQQAETVWRDVDAWVRDRAAALPSGQESDLQSWLKAN